MPKSYRHHPLNRQTFSRRTPTLGTDLVPRILSRKTIAAVVAAAALSYSQIGRYLPLEINPIRAAKANGAAGTDMKRPDDDGKRKRGKADPQMHEMRHNNYRGLYDNFIEVSRSRNMIATLQRQLMPNLVKGLYGLFAAGRARRGRLNQILIWRNF